jgi:hypothetical protein
VVRRVGVVAAAITVLVCASGAVASHTAYGTLAWWGEPERISWCGRDYLPAEGTLLTRAVVEQQRASVPGDAPYPVTTVTRIPPLVGRPVLASVTPAATRDRLHVPCAMVVYLETDTDAYRPYVLSGGP